MIEEKESNQSICNWKIIKNTEAYAVSMNDHGKSCM